MKSLLWSESGCRWMNEALVVRQIIRKVNVFTEDEFTEDEFTAGPNGMVSQILSIGNHVVFNWGLADLKWLFQQISSDDPKPILSLKYKVMICDDIWMKPSPLKTNSTQWMVLWMVLYEWFSPFLVSRFSEQHKNESCFALRIHWLLLNWRYFCPLFRLAKFSCWI